MPHYKDGTVAQVGDVVRGIGYNVKYEIVGVVKHITPGATTCNIEVLHAAQGHDYNDVTQLGARLNTEYGEAAAFERVLPAVAVPVVTPVEPTDNQDPGWMIP